MRSAENYELWAAHVGHTIVVKPTTYKPYYDFMALFCLDCNHTVQGMHNSLENLENLSVSQ